MYFFFEEEEEEKKMVSLDDIIKCSCLKPSHVLKQLSNHQSVVILIRDIKVAHSS